MNKLKTRLATLAIAALGAGAAGAQTLLVVPVENTVDSSTPAASGSMGAAPDTILVVPAQPAVVIVPDTSAPSASAMDQGSTAYPGPAASDTRAMGAAAAQPAVVPPTTRNGEPLASTVQSSTALSPGAFHSADGTPAALAGGTYEMSGGRMIDPTQAPMNTSSRVDHGNAD